MIVGGKGITSEVPNGKTRCLFCLTTRKRGWISEAKYHQNASKCWVQTPVWHVLTIQTCFNYPKTRFEPHKIWRQTTIITVLVCDKLPTCLVGSKSCRTFVVSGARDRSPIKRWMGLGSQNMTSRHWTIHTHIFTYKYGSLAVSTLILFLKSSLAVCYIFILVAVLFLFKSRNLVFILPMNINEQ